MVVAGHDIIQNCRACFSQNGYGIKLLRQGDIFVCPVDGSHQYMIEHGYMKRV
ncbi:MAG: hypothetical protein HZB67_00435 [Candidatus Aenigmarchaeota archaeon]|nr:hypothetical protein [Candidatus Aenigmarchaeota archaeon]MBI5229507.1 hypothetical protein [Candidatus Micrarchaeota archaeon]